MCGFLRAMARSCASISLASHVTWSLRQGAAAAAGAAGPAAVEGFNLSSSLAKA